MKRYAIIVLCLLVTACAQRKEVSLQTTFNVGEVEWSRKAGSNTVSGFAVLRTVGGEARTCAGLEVLLTPDSAYARERQLAIYGSTEGGTKNANLVPKFTNTDPAYLENTLKTRCDGQGSFVFEHVPDGTYYLGTFVVWKANPSSPFLEGGAMMKRVTVQGGTVTKISLP